MTWEILNYYRKKLYYSTSPRRLWPYCFFLKLCFFFSQVPSGKPVEYLLQQQATFGHCLSWESDVSFSVMCQHTFSPHDIKIALWKNLHFGECPVVTSGNHSPAGWCAQGWTKAAVGCLNSTCRSMPIPNLSEDKCGNGEELHMHWSHCMFHKPDLTENDNGTSVYSSLLDDNDLLLTLSRFSGQGVYNSLLLLLPKSVLQLVTNLLSSLTEAVFLSTLTSKPNYFFFIHFFLFYCFNRNNH